MAWKSRRKCRAGEDNKWWSIIHPRVPELNHKRAHLSVSSKMTHVASGCEPHSPGNVGCLRCHPWLMESRGTQRGNMEKDSGSHTALEAISKWEKNIWKLYEWEKAAYSSPGTSRNQALTYSTSPPSYCSPPSCSSWRHLGLLVFQCVPVSWVCLRSFFLAYFLFCSPFGITQTQMKVWAAERHPKSQSPPTDLDRKFNLKPTHGYQQARTLKRWHARAQELVIMLR